MTWAWAALALGFSLATTIAQENSPAQTKAVSRASMEQGSTCYPCDHIFTMVESTADGRRVQDIKVQERGEPKSGTTFMSAWVRGALDHTCDFLRRAYGQESCRSELTGHRHLNLNFTFEPNVGNSDGTTCVCSDVDLVQIYYSEDDKHSVPVSKECRWSHGPGIDTYGGCKTVSGRTVQNYSDLWGCLQEASCEITDDRVQFVPMRDPRGIAVSSHFHRVRYYPQTLRMGQTLHETIMESLPVFCQWIAIRHILAEGIMPGKSHLFWYEDSKEHKVEWHFRLLASFGLQLPASEVSKMVDMASRVGGYNAHPGGFAAVDMRTWKDEVDPRDVAEMNEILRTWLPPVILARLGIPLAV